MHPSTGSCARRAIAASSIRSLENILRTFPRRLGWVRDDSSLDGLEGSGRLVPWWASEARLELRIRPSDAMGFRLSDRADLLFSFS
jgi:hypothetical protein